MDNRIDKLYARFERSGVSEDDVHVCIDNLLWQARVLDGADNTGDAAFDVEQAENIDDARMAVLDTIADLAGIEPDYKGPWHITMYHVSREFGGPEEGGWFYDWYDLVKGTESVVVPSDEALANQIANELTAAETKLKKEAGEQNRFSVIGTADYVWRVEKERGEDQTKERPHYE